MFDNLNRQELILQLLDAVERETRELLHRTETARDMLGSGKVHGAAFYATMMRASHQTCGDSLERLIRISERPKA